MATVKFTSALKRFFPNLQDMDVEGDSVLKVLQEIEAQQPGLTGYLLEEDGSLRKHVNIFLGEELIEDRQALSDRVAENQEILIYQALSGG